GAFPDERERALLVPQAFGARVGVLVVLLPLRVEPASGVLAAARAERSVDFPEVARREAADALLALDQDRERGCLHATDRGELEAAGARIERRHRARAVDPDEPVGLRTADGGT